MNENGDYPKVLTGVWVAWSLLLTLALIWVAKSLLEGNTNKYAIIQTVVLAFTLVVLAWYAYWTLKMQQAMVRQTNVNILPVFIVYIDRSHTIEVPRDGEARPCVELENIGNGEALNVQIDTIEIEFEDKRVYNVWAEPKILFDGVVSIASKETVVVAYYSQYRSDSEVVSNDKWNWIHNLKPKRTAKEYEMKIRFMDILGNRYVQVIHIGKNGCWPGVVIPDTSERRLPTHLPRLNDFTESPLKYR
jgi:hypothetical protein